MIKKTEIMVASWAVLLCLFASCTKYNYVDVPAPISHADKSMWEYFSTDPYNWKYTQQLIDRAGLRDIFEGKSAYGDNFTFFGITSISIERYLLEKKRAEGLEQTPTVADLPVEECREWVLTSIYPKRLMLDEWKPGQKAAGEIVGTGGEMCKMASGKELWIYTYRAPFNAVPQMGLKQIHLVSPDKQKEFVVSSHNILTKTGVVHSLNYNFTLNDF